MLTIITAVFIRYLLAPLSGGANSERAKTREMKRVIEIHLFIYIEKEMLVRKRGEINKSS